MAAVRSQQVPDHATFSPFAIWGELGVTEHMGGMGATRKLVSACQIQPGERVLDMGCGTGFTACLLADEYGAVVQGMDLTAHVIQVARARAARAAQPVAPGFLQADAHLLPFASGSLDVVIVESVLVFCRAEEVAAEIGRVLRPGGRVGDNELAFLRLPPPDLLTLLSDALKLHPFTTSDWAAVFERAGCEVTSAVIRPLSLGAQFASHLRVDGFRRYLSAVLRGLANPIMRRTFLNRTMWKAARHFRPYVGYGLFVARKTV